jgi:hypothetical protein
MGAMQQQQQQHHPVVQIQAVQPVSSTGMVNVGFAQNVAFAAASSQVSPAQSAHPQPVQQQPAQPSAQVDAAAANPVVSSESVSALLHMTHMLEGMYVHTPYAVL